MTALATAVIGFPRWTHLATWSGGGWLAAYPSSNLGSLPLARVARSTSAATANTQVIVTLDKARPVRMLALVRHNISLSGRLRLRFYSDAARTVLVHDTGWTDVWPIVYPYGTVEWEDDRWWSGRYTPEEIEGYPWLCPVWLPQPYVARAVHVEIDDTANSAGYVEVGMVEIALGWQWSINFGHGAQHGYRFRSRAVEALGGGKVFDARPKPRIWRGEVDQMPADEAMAQAAEMLRRLDLYTPVLWLPEPGNPIHWPRTAFLARLTDPGLMAYVIGDARRVPIALEEVL